MRKNLKNKKGFTLVEVIVVIVILGILMAIAIPNVVAYIDNANEKADGLAVRNVYLAACSVMAEASTRADFNDATNGGLTADDFDEIAELAGLNKAQAAAGETPAVACDVGASNSTTAKYKVYYEGKVITKIELIASAAATNKLVTYTPDGTITFAELTT